MQFCRKDLVSEGRGEMRKNWMDTKVICLKEILIYEYSQLQCESVVIKVDGNIAEHAFADSKYLKNICIYGNDTVLGLGVFSYCRNLQSVQLYDVSVIGEGAFTWCDQLESIFLDVCELQKGAFFQCKSLKKVVFSEKLNTIHKGSFYGCDNLKKVVFLGPPVIDDAFEWDNDDLDICIKREYECILENFIMTDYIKKHIVYFDLGNCETRDARSQT